MAHPLLIPVRPEHHLLLSVDVHEVAGEVTTPIACLQGIWMKATELLSTAGSMAPAPGCDSEA